MLKFRFLKMNPEATVYDWKEFKKMNWLYLKCIKINVFIFWLINLFLIKFAIFLTFEKVDGFGCVQLVSL